MTRVPAGDAGLVYSFVDTDSIRVESQQLQCEHSWRAEFSTDFRIPVSNVGTARMFMQFDFFGSNGATTPRLRHAYAQIANILVGQTFTNFMDPDALAGLAGRPRTNAGPQRASSAG